MIWEHTSKFESTEVVCSGSQEINAKQRWLLSPKLWSKTLISLSSCHKNINNNKKNLNVKIAIFLLAVTSDSFLYLHNSSAFCFGWQRSHTPLGSRWALCLDELYIQKHRCRSNTKYWAMRCVLLLSFLCHSWPITKFSLSPSNS